MTFYIPIRKSTKLDKSASMKETKTMIQNLRENNPILSTLIDYGYNTKVDELLRIQPQDLQIFQKSLEKESPKSHNHYSPDKLKKKQCLSFINYKAEPGKLRETHRTSRSKNTPKERKISIAIETPPEMKRLTGRMFRLPNILESRIKFKTHNNLKPVRSYLREEFKNSSAKRYKTEMIEPKLSRIRVCRNNYAQSLNNILNEFDSPQLRSNRQIIRCHNECERILNEEQQLVKEYERFQNLGNPPKDIISLNNLLRTFQRTAKKHMDSDLAHQISYMDHRRYDVVLKHEEELHKLNMAHFQGRDKKQKIQEIKNGLNQSLSDKLGFKLNSKGKEVYNNRNKVVK